MVRSDKSLDSKFNNSNEWGVDVVTGKSGADVNRYQLPDGLKARLSFSGSERNSLFMRDSNSVFQNVSGITGLDSKSDGRTVATIDIDKDGRNDVVFTNSNRPTLRIYHNRTKTLVPENQFVAVQVVGGNTTSGSSKFTNRDGIGAIIRVRHSGQTQMKEVRCGEGLATQRSRCHLFGLGAASTVDEISVTWPSGQKSIAQNIGANKQLVFYENPEQTDGESFVVKSYQDEALGRIAFEPRKGNRFPIGLRSKQGNQISIFTAMATWCDKCKSHVPDTKALTRKFGNKIQMFAVPIDSKDTKEKLQRYTSQYKPAYRLMPPDERYSKVFVGFVVQQLGFARLPFSVIVDSEQNVIATLDRFPTVSDIEKALSGLKQTQ